MHEFRFEPARLPPEAEALRREVRELIAAEVARGGFVPKRNSWSSFDPDFSRKCGERGWIGMRWPKQYGGRERSALERYVVTEEMLAGGAPIGAHWIADRQSGNQILRHGSERARREILPRIAAGTCFFSIGMSEPDSGSDLANVRTRATRAEGGWKLSGTKVWTSNAHRTHYLIALARSAPKEEDRHAGLTQFIVRLDAPGVAVRPIHNLYGGHDFNQVIFDDVRVEDDMVVGEVGAGWRMVTSELAFERSGPDRFLSTFQLLRETVNELGAEPGERAAADIGRFVAHLATLRRMSLSISGMLEKGAQPAVEAALVKDIGTTLEREMPESFRHLVPGEPALGAGASYAELLGKTMLQAPGFTIRGGTREILRGMIARGLGLR
ncbi:MAG TPA: acyl-CoA dehydrogenase family protein [Burkholderiales bacterium]|nr:acyl-CoA dehydrogenase family protein [Burkholderiales bacterium]